VDDLALLTGLARQLGAALALVLPGEWHALDPTTVRILLSETISMPRGRDPVGTWGAPVQGDHPVHRDLLEVFGWLWMVLLPRSLPIEIDVPGRREESIGAVDHHLH